MSDWISSEVSRLLRDDGADAVQRAVSCQRGRGVKVEPRDLGYRGGWRMEEEEDGGWRRGSSERATRRCGTNAKREAGLLGERVRERLELGSTRRAGERE